MQKKFFRFLLPLASVVLIAVTVLTGCGKNGNNDDSNTASNSSVVETIPTTPPVTEAVQDIGQGSTVFKFEVTNNDKTVGKWSVHMDEKTVGDALVAVGLIKGDTSELGLYVKEVNGVKADYDADKSYWAFYVDGEYATKGVDETSIEANKTYSFVYSKE